jgi:hypothetical protein
LTNGLFLQKETAPLLEGGTKLIGHRITLFEADSKVIIDLYSGCQKEPAPESIPFRLQSIGLIPVRSCLKRLFLRQLLYPRH